MNKTITPSERWLFLIGSLLLAISSLSLASCKRSGHSSDPRLRQIDEMLDSQLPPGTAKSRVILYLSSQGFPVENTSDPRAITATVRHVDTETLQPVNASVTFHFDSQDKLTTYDLTVH
jgi:hypothetical protein